MIEYILALILASLLSYTLPYMIVSIFVYMFSCIQKLFDISIVVPIISITAPIILLIILAVSFRPLYFIPV
jgi:hypothetical protein